MAALLITACRPGSDASRTVPLDTWLPLAVDGVPVQTQIAINTEEQRRGLMHRDSLPPENGMLFPYPTARRLSFWMANTRIPLDIGFFDGDGRLLEIHRMVPFDTNATPSRSDQVQYALEVNSGWFARHQLKPGAQMDVDLLKAALQARGANPREYGL